MYLFIDYNCFLRWVMWPMGLSLKLQFISILLEIKLTIIKGGSRTSMRPSFAMLFWLFYTNKVYYTFTIVIIQCLQYALYSLLSLKKTKGMCEGDIKTNPRTQEFYRAPRFWILGSATDNSSLFIISFIISIIFIIHSYQDLFKASPVS